ncbi:DPP IV N-terminal domain-containing protein [Chloracidobacterium validum]|uniref:DPP IV N-terminal domain-containing protein n=1 Tax=Chloracidobacterium validum TaxID=2821543 RepID=A0ABX8BCE8_9BACT|nr:S9 family peptidase [Chloracidobacterium validum]QUW03313.1 DPP IV N-terminal domain-containing protein [Chloracidobacterium validum]
MYFQRQVSWSEWWLGVLLTASLVVPVAAQSAPTAAKKATKQLTLEALFDPVQRVNFSGSLPRLVWLPGGQHYLAFEVNAQTRQTEVVRVETATGKRTPFHDPARMQSALEAAGMAADDSRAAASLRTAVFDAGFRRALLSGDNDLYCYDFVAERAERLTMSPAAAEEEYDFSPDGRRVSFVRGNDLFVLDLAASPRTERRLTQDGSTSIFNGILDWVYEEEVYGRGKRRGYWWDPSGTLLAYLRLDDTNVPVHILTDDVPFRQQVERTHYPQAGDPNPLVSLRVVTVDGEQAEVGLPDYPADDRIITRVGWHPREANRLLFEVQNRRQTRLDLNATTVLMLESMPPQPRPAAVERLLREESTTAWVEVVELPLFLPDGSFLWQSDESGFRHIYRHAADGKRLRALTQGEWDVREVYGVGDTHVYFSAAAHSPIANHLYRVKLDGRELTRLSQTEGTHAADFNADCTAYFDVSSTAAEPPRLSLHRADGTPIRVVADNAEARALADEYGVARPDFLQVKTRDGFVMEAMVLRPPDFDPQKKYPVWCYAYSGPGAQSVVDRWGGQRMLWHQLLAQRGYLVWVCDNRSASGKGMRSMAPVYGKLGELELRDLEDGIAYLKTLPYVDGNRIGLWGWSYGGYMTAYALTHSTAFKCGIAGAPVTDWRNYDSIYTERYMKLPEDNPEGYARSSVVAAAKQLHGPLLLIHGLMDDNVHPRNSVQLMDALQKADRPFDFLAYPQSRHGVVTPYRVKHLYGRMLAFIERHL